jgi:nucleoside-diphosphate-sugar epimerase
MQSSASALASQCPFQSGRVWDAPRAAAMAGAGSRRARRQRLVYLPGVSRRASIRCGAFVSSGICFTIIGAGGFIGSALVAWLQSQGETVHPVTRAPLSALLGGRRDTGHVIDCAGLTGDAQATSLELSEAHIGLVAHCISELHFASFLLLSSTQVYGSALDTREDAVLAVSPLEPAALYRVTKLAGEAVCLADPRPGVRVVRLSNVYGRGMSAHGLLGRLLRQGQATGDITFPESAASATDHVNIAEVVRLLPTIATMGRQRLYNLAAGHNVSHAAIASRLHDLTGWRVGFAPGAPTQRPSPIDTGRLASEFGAPASNVMADLPTLVDLAQDSQCSPSMSHAAA